MKKGRKMLIYNRLIDQIILKLFCEMFGYFLRILSCQCLVMNNNIWVVEFCICCLFVDV